MTPEEKFLSDRKAYYQNTFVLMEIVKCLKNRECAWIDRDGKKNIRYLYASKVDFLKIHFDKLDFYNYRVNMYCSVATLSHIPIITYNLKTRRLTPEYKDVNENYAKFVTSYEIFFDFDLKEDFESGFKEAKEFKKILDEMKVPYLLHNSSKRGFHFIIPNEFCNNKDPLKNVDIFRDVIYNIKGIYDFKFLDSSVTDLKRIRKLQYSVVSDGSICLPLNDKEFEYFTPQDVEIKNVLQNIKIKNRGLLLRDFGLDKIQLQKNVEKFIKEYR